MKTKVYYFSTKGQCNTDAIFNNLPLNIREHCRRYSNPEQQLRSAVCWYMLLDKLENDYTIKVNHLQVGFTSGKPYFLNSTIYFNITHSADFGAIIISDRACGVDIEKDISVEKHKLAEKVMSDKEYREFMNVSSQKEFFNQLWVRKEAYAKYLGMGINHSIFNETCPNTNVLKLLMDGESYYLSWYADTKEVEIVRS